uniref:Uncharacterized protein n=1 Tax=Ditylenchus dipsaci TaxID=166011 RepID=A0A915CM07_9BILA
MNVQQMSSSLMPSVFCSLSKLAGCSSLVLVLLLLIIGDLSHAFYILENPEASFGGRAIAVRGKRNYPLEEPEQSAFLVEWVEPGEMPLLQQNQPMQLQIDQDNVGNDGREQVYVIEEPETDDQRQLVLVPEGRQPNGFKYQVGMDGGRLMKRSSPQQMENVDQSVWLAYPSKNAPQEDESTEAMLDELLLKMAAEVEKERQESEKSEALQRLIAEAMYQQKAQQMQADQMDYLQREQQLKESLRSKRSQPATDLSTAYELANEYGQALLPEDIEGAFQLSNGQPTEFLMPTGADWDKSNDDRFQLVRGKRGSPAGYQLVMIP